jgi:hypothetical protein
VSALEAYAGRVDKSLLRQSPHHEITKMLASTDHWFVDINAIALNAAIRGSIFAEPDACFMMMIALPLGSTPAFATAHAVTP